MSSFRLPEPKPLTLGLAWILLLILAAVLLAASQRPMGWGRYEFNILQPFQGRLRLTPYPALEVERSLFSVGQPAVSVYPLSSGRRGGFVRNLSFLDGELVTLEARILCAGNLTMLEVAEDTVARVTRTIEFPQPEPIRKSGEVTLRGEIVDLKSYLGFREPEFGDLLRSPAAGAIRAGIPPVLLVIDRQRRRTAFLLVARDGTPAGDAVLGRIATRIEVRGELRMWADFPVLAADPSTYRSLWPWE
ncbi:MAG: hypothetical protein KIT83_04710 [Bryobacterales bacterium]|nr:hypothetical protein [Bryobacterales bacterium]